MEMGDPFLAFVEFARRSLTPQPPSSSHATCNQPPKLKQQQQQQQQEDGNAPSWSWTVSRILCCCRSYPSGVTSAILVSELFQAWQEKDMLEAHSRHNAIDLTKIKTLPLQRNRMPKQFNFSKMATIDSIYEKKFVSLDAILEVIVVDVQLIQGTKSYLVALGDAWSINTIDLYLHRRFYDLLDSEGGILRKGREVRLTGCRLRTALSISLGKPRLLPTEYFVILLNEDQDDDALLLGAQFCSDTFSSIELRDSPLDSNYCFYTKLEKIEEADMQDNNQHSKRQTFLLSDNNGDILPLVFWDESIILADLFSVGSMIAVERPIVSRFFNTNVQTSSIFLEYGNRTRLYTIPIIHHEEQVTIRPTQAASKLYAHSRLTDSTYGNAENHSLSQVMLDRDAQGYINFKKYPAQLLVEGLQPKMSNVTLYGFVTYLSNISCMGERLSNKSRFILGLEDGSGVVHIKIHFLSGWATDEIFAGHTIVISGLRTSQDESGRLSCRWDEREAEASMVNISICPGVLSSSCLHKIIPLACLSDDWSPSAGHVFKVCIGKLSLEELAIVPVHTSCGHPLYQNADHQWICSLCSCFAEDIAQRYSTIMTLYDFDQHATPGVRVACFGQAATDILQTSPEEFSNWPEDVQTMYLCSLEDEVFYVNIFKQGQEFLAIDNYIMEFEKKVRLLSFAVSCALKAT